MDKKYKTQIDDLTARWKRALADYQNLEKRVTAEKEDFVKFVNAGLILKILPALDSLQKAQDHLRDEGLGLAIKQLRDALVQEGLEEIEVIDKPFNPKEMECVAVVEGDEEKVVEELRKGYKLKDRVIRVAQVKVGKQRVSRISEEKVTMYE